MSNIKVGGKAFRVETRTQVAQPDESRAARAAGGLIGWGLRRAGASTIDERIVVGTRTVTTDGSPMRLECSVAWIDRRERSKDETEETRLTEGMDCEERNADSVIVRGGKWRFRYGVPPTADSLRAIADTVGLSPLPFSPAHAVLLVEGDARAEYRLTEEPFGTVLGIPRSGGWRVQRSDSTTIGMLRTPPAFGCSDHCALDLRDASDREESVLRFLAAALAVPLQR